MPDSPIHRIQSILARHAPLEAEREIQRHNEAESFVSLTADIFDSVAGRRTVPPPVCVQVEVTGNCGSAKCLLCRRWTDRLPADQEMNLGEIRTVLMDLADMGVQSIVISGGEPLTRKDAPLILETAASVGLKVGLITDGTNISTECADAIVKYCRWVTVSLDGPDPHVYKRVRGWDGFDLVVCGLIRLHNARPASQRVPRTSLVFTISGLNIDSVAATIEWFHRNRHLADWLRFKFAHGQDNWQFRNLAAKDAIVKLANELDEIALNRPQLLDGTNANYIRNRFLQDASATDIATGRPFQTRVYEPGHKDRLCYTPYLFSLIDNTGAVYPCCYLNFDNHPLKSHIAERESFCMGNIHDESFISIWNGSKYDNLRKMPSVNTRTICSECTRHYQHNRVMNELGSLYFNLSAEEQQSYRVTCQDELGNPPDDAVWF